VEHSATLLPESLQGHGESAEEEDLKIVEQVKLKNNASPVEALDFDAGHDDDDDDFMIGATDEEKLPQEKVQDNVPEDDDDDDTEFMIGAPSNHELAPRMNKVEGISNDHRTKSNIPSGDEASTSPPNPNTAVPVSRGVLSIAARAAIHAAEKEAHCMLEQDTAARTDEEQVKRLKKKKKKKDGDDKKRRKKSLGVVSDSFAA
jgi:hypothetical protein